jgi:hypothetical protein
MICKSGHNIYKEECKQCRNLEKELINKMKKIKGMTTLD